MAVIHIYKVTCQRVTRFARVAWYGLVRKRYHYWAAVITVGAGVWCFQTGRLGLFPFDQSIIFEGGSRIAAGQTPFVDFVAPTGIPLFFLQGWLFDLFGPTWNVYVGTAATMNAGAALITYLIVRQLPGTTRVLALAACIVTAIWFYPPFGTPWFEHTAALMGLIALYFVAAVVQRPVNGEKYYLLTAGAFAALAFLTKQNAGAFIIPTLIVLLLTESSRDKAKLQGRSLAFVTGAGSVLAVFGGWIILLGKPEVFWRYFWTIPSVEGRERLQLQLDLAADGEVVPLLTVIIVILLTLTMARVVYGQIVSQSQDPKAQHVELAKGLLSGLLWYQAAMFLTTKNSFWSSAHYLGLVVALVGTVYRGRHRLAPSQGRGSLLQRGESVLSVGAVAAIVVIGVHVASTRSVHDIFRNRVVRFGPPCNIERLNSLHWANPTAYGGRNITCGNLENLIETVGGVDQGVFFGDFTMVSALASVENVSPLIWYHKGLTYEAGYDPLVDSWLARRLIDSKTQVFVRERARYSPLLSDWNDFLLASAVLEACYNRQQEIGGFELFSRMKCLPTNFKSSE